MIMGGKSVLVAGRGAFQTLQPWSIIASNLVATLIMLAILFRDHSPSFGELMTSAE